MIFVRQLHTRIDDGLHRDLKRRAMAEGRSVNALVTALLRTALIGQDQRELVRARMRALGRRATVPRPRKAPSLDTVEKLTRGLGKRVSERARGGPRPEMTLLYAHSRKVAKSLGLVVR